MSPSEIELQLQMHAMHALHTVPHQLVDTTWLVQQPEIVNAFHDALVKLPRDDQPIGFALLAKLCNLDHLRSETEAPAHLLPHANTSAYCTKCKEDDMFGHVQVDISCGLQVSWISFQFSLCRLCQLVNQATSPPTLTSGDIVTLRFA